jgi:hypothetical protein
VTERPAETQIPNNKEVLMTGVETIAGVLTQEKARAMPSPADLAAAALWPGTPTEPSRRTATNCAPTFTG